MKAMILAAGRGERLRPLTDTLPKPLIPVYGKPLIVHHLEALARAGFNDVLVNLSWLGNKIRDVLDDGARFGVHIEYSEETDALETAGGIVQALDRLGERFVVVNADIFTDYDFSALHRHSGDAHLVMVDNPAHNAHGDFSLRGSRIGNAATQRLTFSGISQFHRRFFESFPPGKRPLAPLLREKAALHRISGELHQGQWSDIGTLDRWRLLIDSEAESKQR